MVLPLFLSWISRPGAALRWPLFIGGDDQNNINSTRLAFLAVPS